MPFWYALTLLLTMVEGAIYLAYLWPLTHLDRCIVRFVMLVIVCTVTILVPINNRIASWETSTPPADWKRYRSRWDLLHRWRVVVLTTAFVLLIVAFCNQRSCGHDASAGPIEPQGGQSHARDSTTHAPLPADDLSRALALAQLDSPTAQHIGLVGNTYTITVAGKDTNGRFCVIDMHVPPGGGPGPHRHDFEETFILLEGEVE